MTLKMKGASWDSLFLTFVRVVTTFTALLQTKILSKGLALYQYGSYSQILLASGIVTSVIILGLGDGLNYFYNRADADNKEEKVGAVNTIFLIEILLGLLGAGALILLRGPLAMYFDNSAVKILLPLVALKPLLDNVIYFYQLLFISHKRAKLIAVQNLTFGLAKLAVTWLIVKLYADLVYLLICMLALDVLQLLIFKIIFGKRAFWIRPHKGNLHSIRSILVYSIPMGVFALTNTMIRDVDKLVVGKFADTEVLAIYTNCSKILPFDIIAFSFATVLIPYIMKYVTAKDRKNTALLYANYLQVGYYSVWTLATAVLIVPEQAISFLYSDAYLPGKAVFILYLLDTMIRFANTHLILIASGHSKTVMAYSVLSLIVNTVLNIAFYMLFGLIGPALATLIVTLAYTALIIRKTTAVIGLQICEVFDLRKILLFVVKLAVSAMLFYIADQALLRCGCNETVAMIAVMGGFAVTNLALNLRDIRNVFSTINSLKI